MVDNLPPGLNDEYTHHVAIQISRQLNSQTVNDYLAQNIVKIARNQPGPKTFILACKGLGRYPDEFLTGGEGSETTKVPSHDPLQNTKKPFAGV
jgi:pre-mRNA-splicing factor ATP-dependent RNA helicase DHX38/PRP16